MKRIISILLAIIMILSLAACGGGSKKKNTPVAGGAAWGMPPDADGLVTMSDYLSAGQTIWYEVSGDDIVGRESSVKTIFVLQDDGTMISAKPGIKLGELAQMTDEDIVSLVKENFEVEVEEVARRVANDAVDLFEKNRREGFKEVSKERVEESQQRASETAEEIRVFIDTALPYRLGINTDATGNHTQTEIFAYQYPDYHYERFSTAIYSLEMQTRAYNLVTLPLDFQTGRLSVIEVYTSLYGGYMTDDFKTYLITRIDDDIALSLDEVGYTDIPLDADVESLFE